MSRSFDPHTEERSAINGLRCPRRLFIGRELDQTCQVMLRFFRCLVEETHHSCNEYASNTYKINLKGLSFRSKHNICIFLEKFQWKTNIIHIRPISILKSPAPCLNIKVGKFRFLSNFWAKSRGSLPQGQHQQVRSRLKVACEEERGVGVWDDKIVPRTLHCIVFWAWKLS